MVGADLYDDVIVGAGSAGAVLAARLSEEADRRVLLLEAGPDYPTVEATPRDLLVVGPPAAEHDWGFTATVVPGRVIPYRRGKVTGGSSAINQGVALRGVPADYDDWAALGNEEWGWRRVLPFFRRLEDDQDERGPMHGQGGPVPIRRARTAELHPVQRAFVDACRGLGFAEVADHNHPAATGVGPWPRNVRDGVLISTAISHLLPARPRPNLTIRPHCLVERVLVDGGRAVGVELADGTDRRRVEGRRTTLCAGAIGSPPILLRSGIGPRGALAALGVTPRADLPGVGAHLIDHPAAALVFVPKPGTWDGPPEPSGFVLRYATPGSGDLNDMQLFFTVRPSDPAPQPAHGAAGVPPVEFRLGVVLQRPRSRGRVALTSADPHVPPAIEPNCLDHPEDVRRMVAGLRLAWAVARAPALAAYLEPQAGLTDRLVASEAALEAYLRGGVSTLNHPAGTARMGPAGDGDAVTDQYCRVQGIAGLRVADASVMPTIPRANINLTCVMIGERVADWMRARPTD